MRDPDSDGLPRSSWILKFRRVTSKGRTYYPEVDGLRFIAIASVLAFHVVHAAGFHDYTVEAGSEIWMPHIQHGARGVELFFAISGFILGLPFARHYLGGGGKVRLSKYLIRRVTRLEPPYVLALIGFYVAAQVLQTADALEPGFWQSFWLRLVYGYGLVHQNAPKLNGATWSLEIEVQFYLLAPLIAYVFRLPAVLRRAAIVVTIGYTAFITGGDDLSLRYTVFGFLHFFMVGFLLADLHVVSPPLEGNGRFQILADIAGLVGLLGIAALTENLLSNVLMPWLVGLVLIAGMRGWWFRRACSLPWVAVIGGMCYSLYLIHYPIMSWIASRMSLEGLGPWEASFRLGSIALPIVFLLGSVFYLLVERPCMEPDWPKRLIGRLRKGFGRQGAVE